MSLSGKMKRNFTAGFRPGGIVREADGFYNTSTADENPAESEAVRHAQEVFGSVRLSGDSRMQAASERRRIWHHFWKIKNLWL